MSESGPQGMFSIGEFSRIVGMTVKTLRFYHEQGLLIPAHIDPQTGYRFYVERQLERTRAIAYLRSLEFPLEEIKQILSDASGDEDRIVDAMLKHKTSIEQKIKHLRGVVRSLDRFITEEKEAALMAQTSFEVQEKTLDPILVAGVRMKGHYKDCGEGFKKIGKALGRYITSPALMLHFDAEYKDDADYEVCMPLKQSATADGISVRELPGGRCVSLLYQGPYDQVGSSYAKILKYINDRGYKFLMPTRQVYLKGPGMILKGNPKKYLTEIQLMIES